MNKQRKAIISIMLMITMINSVTCTTTKVTTQREILSGEKRTPIECAPPPPYSEDLQQLFHMLEIQLTRINCRGKTAFIRDKGEPRPIRVRSKIKIVFKVKDIQEGKVILLYNDKKLTWGMDFQEKEKPKPNPVKLLLDHFGIYLEGVISTPKEKSVLIFVTENGKQRFIGIGDEIKLVFEVAEICEDKVVLLYQARKLDWKANASHSIKSD